MGVLESVFNSREFDLNDDVLMEFDNYFDEESKDYNSFSLDKEGISNLRNFAAQMKSVDSDSTIYVGTYGYEITNSKGEKSTYADTLWIDTVLSISKIKELIEECDIAKPSDTSSLEDCNDIGKGKVWLVIQKGQEPQIIELTNHKKLIVLYWD